MIALIMSLEEGSGVNRRWFVFLRGKARSCYSSCHGRLNYIGDGASLTLSSWVKPSQRSCVSPRAEGLGKSKGVFRERKKEDREGGVLTRTFMVLPFCQ